jgi:hypothetical protein
MKIVILALALFPMSAFAMSEAERVMNWKFNSDSDGTYLAEIEMQRQLILQDVDREYLNERHAMEDAQKTEATQRLERTIEQLDRWIFSEQDLKGKCEALSGKMDETIGAVRKYRIANLTESLKVEELSLDFRQEADLNGVDMVKVSELTNACAKFEMSPDRSLPVCRIVALFTTKEYESLTELTPQVIGEEIKAFDKRQADQKVSCKNIEIQAQVFQTRKDAYQARLDALKGKK